RTDPLHAAEFAAHYPDVADRSNETTAATKAAAHVNTPTTAYFDTLGRPFLTVAHNKVVCPNHDLDGTEDKFHTRVELDIEGNLRGKVVQLFDQAGAVTSDEYDFKGNLLRGQRQLAKDYKTTLDWSAAVPLEAENYTSRTRYDALNRPIQIIAPHSDQAGSTV